MNDMSERENGIGAAIKAQRLVRGYTLAELAEKAGTSASYLSDIERGRTLPSLEKLHDIAEAFGYEDVIVTFVSRDRRASYELIADNAKFLKWIDKQVELAHQLVEVYEQMKQDVETGP